MNSKLLSVIAGPLFGAIVGLFLSLHFNLAMCITAGMVVWMLTWWLSEALPMAVTALLPILILSSSEILPIHDCYKEYSDRFVFLFLGGFLLSLAFEKWKLHERLSYFILSQVGQSPSAILLGFMCCTYLISMWISNTATAIMMMPLAIGITNSSNQASKNFSRSLVLGIAYSASIGGMATILGSPPNAALVGILESQFNQEVTFLQWMIWGTPFSLTLLLVTYLILLRDIKKNQRERIHVERWIDREMPAMTDEQKTMLIIFIGTATLWIFQHPLSLMLGHWFNDTFIALVASLLLFIPFKKSALLEWRDTERLPWGILLMFGGGLTMAAGCKEAGWMEWVGSLFHGISPNSIYFQLALITISIVLTALMSNLAMIAVFIPIVGQIAFDLHINPWFLALPVGLAAGCDFMFPMSTPPNAIAYSSGFVKTKEMFRIGLVVNISAGLLLLTLMHLVPH
jgi:sodium-dependent dicarboxylate transporter 2/3/5